MGNLKSKITVSQAALQMEGKFQCSLLERILSSSPHSLSLLHYSNLRTIRFASLELPGKNYQEVLELL